MQSCVRDFSNTPDKRKYDFLRKIIDSANGSRASIKPGEPDVDTFTQVSDIHK